ncbi:MAG: GspH/FimT family pseudopilin [Steroidobacteraceae bacterium]
MDTCRRTSQIGFTLMEILMTIAIAAIVAMIGIPSFRYVTNANRISSEVNGLLGDLQFARSEAIKEGQNVTVCISTSGTSCDGGNPATWQNGWIVYSNPTGVTTPVANSTLRIQAPFTSTDTFVAVPTATSEFTFNREGYAAGIAGNGILIELHDSTGTTAWTRCLSVYMNGMTQTAQYNQVVDAGTCQ